MKPRICRNQGCDKEVLCLGLCARDYYKTTKSPEKNSWTMMKQRCYNKNAAGYENYGGRGIRVCDKWRISFKGFLEDMGLRPDIGYTLDRIDNDGNYEPTNCRWATRNIQTINQRLTTRNTSGHKGVGFIKRSSKWEAHIKVKGRSIDLGHYDNIEDAIFARKCGEMRYFKPLLDYCDVTCNNKGMTV